MIVSGAFLVRLLRRGVAAGADAAEGTESSSEIIATGAVAAAGAILGDEALTVATTVKMIQNVLIGAIAFAVAVYWVRYQEPSTTGDEPGMGEIWKRFPKFVLGFLRLKFEEWLLSLFFNRFSLSPVKIALVMNKASQRESSITSPRPPP